MCAASPQSSVRFRFIRTTHALFQPMAAALPTARFSPESLRTAFWAPDPPPSVEEQQIVTAQADQARDRELLGRLEARRKARRSGTTKESPNHRSPRAVLTLDGSTTALAPVPLD